MTGVSGDYQQDERAPGIRVQRAECDDDCKRPHCPIAHRDGKPRHSWEKAGTVLCGACYRDIDKQLAELDRFEHDATQFEADTILAASLDPGVSGSRDPNWHADPRFARAVADVTSKLALWAINVADYRNMTPPDAAGRAFPYPGPVCPDGCAHRSCRTISRSHEPPKTNVARASSSFLRRHHDWSITQDWAKDYAEEILELGRVAFNLLHPSGRRRFTHDVMGCAEEGCNGMMWALLTPADPYAEAASELVCDTCGMRIGSGDWVTYGRRIRAKDAA